MPEGIQAYTTLIIANRSGRLISKILLDLYLETKSGYLLRAVGDNPTCWLLLWQRIRGM